jgi:hypothetical protein
MENAGGKRKLEKQEKQNSTHGSRVENVREDIHQKKVGNDQM